MTVEPLLTADEVGEILKMTRGAVYAAAERGELPGLVRIGQRRLRFRAEEIRRFTERGSVAPGKGSASAKS